MTLDAHEFIRRFLLHILPDGFMRIRHFGFLANRSKKHALLNAASCWDSTPLCLKSLTNQPTICYENSPAPIFLAVLVARREP